MYMYSMFLLFCQSNSTKLHQQLTIYMYNLSSNRKLSMWQPRTYNLFIISATCSLVFQFCFFNTHTQHTTRALSIFIFFRIGWKSKTTKSIFQWQSNRMLFLAAQPRNKCVRSVRHQMFLMVYVCVYFEPIRNARILRS